MRRILFTIVATALMLASCADSHHQRIRKAVERQLEDFPSSSLLDLYKSFFQDNFGPGHIVADTAAARAYIMSELAGAAEYDRHYFEPAGTGENFYRVSLATVADSVVPMDLFFDAFYESVKEVQPVDVEQWKGQWAGILEVIEDMNLHLPDFERDRASLDSLLATDNYAFHHSPRYNRLYKPHYRLIRKDIFFDRIKPLIDSSRVE